jgi:DNA polymerase-1
VTLLSEKDVALVVERLEQLRPGDPIAIDCETTGLHPYQGDKLRGFSIAFRWTAANAMVSFYVPVGYPEGNLSTASVRRICQAIRDADPTYVYHHAKFDLRFLRQLPRAADGGTFFPVPPVGRFWDTKIVCWLMDENMSSSLKEVAAYLWGEDQKDEQKAIKALIKERGGWDKLTAEDTGTYGAKDAEQTLRLYEHQVATLSGLFTPMLYGNPRPAVARELRIQGVLLRMEDNGIMVDSGYLEELLETAQKSCSEIEELMLERYGVNVNSPKQVSELVYWTLKLKRKDGKAIDLSAYTLTDSDKEYLKANKALPTPPSVARSVLEELDDPSGVVADILKHRRLRKAISSYLTPLSTMVGDDGRIHPTFWSMGTVTGRFSCSDPNLQTIPRSDTLPGVRDIFVAPEGYELWSYDLKAAEQRVIAGMAQEPVLLDGIAAGTDMHGVLASRECLARASPGLQRRFAKNIGYGFFYGLTSPVTAAKYISGKDATKTGEADPGRAAGAVPQRRQADADHDIRYA